MTRAGFPHSDTPGSQLGCQLPRAYRRLQRPSSALDAKASTMCPLQLAKHKHSTKTTKTHTTKTNTHTQTLCGRCSRPLFTNQTTRTNQSTTGHRGPAAGSDVSEPQQCARYHPTNQPPTPFHAATLQYQGTKGPPAGWLKRRRLHYPNTTNSPTGHPPAATSHQVGGVCSLERR